MLLSFAVRNILRHKARSGIALLAISCGCVALIFANGFFEDAYRKIRENEISAHTGHLQIFRKGYRESAGRDPFGLMIVDPNAVMSLVKSIDGVQTVDPRIQFAGLLSLNDNSVSFFAQGVDPTRERMERRSQITQAELKSVMPSGGAIIESGDPLSAGVPNGVMVGRGLAEALNARPGDDLVLLAKTADDSINGMDVHVQGVFYSGIKEVDDYALQLPLESAQKIVRTAHIQSIIVRLNRTEDLARIKSTLESEFKRRGLDLEIRTWNQMSQFAESTKILFQNWFRVLRIIILLVVIFSIYNTINMSIAERTAEIGTMRAMGTTRRGVVNLFLLEGLALGAVGGIAGVASGVAVNLISSHIGISMPTPPGFSVNWIAEPLIIPRTLATSFLLAITASVLSTYFPAKRAAKLEIAHALRFIN